MELLEQMEMMQLMQHKELQEMMRLIIINLAITIAMVTVMDIPIQTMVQILVQTQQPMVQTQQTMVQTLHTLTIIMLIIIQLYI